MRATCWVAPKGGGLAERLSTPKGEESFPRFSPDGSLIAFSGNYDGNEDIYVMPSAGALPTRLTHHPYSERMLNWYPGSFSGKTTLHREPVKLVELNRPSPSGEAKRMEAPSGYQFSIRSEYG